MSVNVSWYQVISSQYHSQDEEGNYAFGYNNVNGARQEVSLISF